LRTAKDVVAHLRACQALANKFGEQGYKMAVTPTEQALLDELRLIRDEGWFEGESECQTDELRRAAGLRRSDLSMLLGRLHHDDVLADPTMAILETMAYFKKTRNNARES